MSVQDDGMDVDPDARSEDGVADENEIEVDPDEEDDEDEGEDGVADEDEIEVDPDEEDDEEDEEDTAITEAAVKAVDDIIDQLVDLMQEKKGDIQRHANTKGGWEGWLQVECIDHLTKMNLFSHDLSREQHVFPPKPPSKKSKSKKSPPKKPEAKRSQQSIDLWSTPTKQPNKGPTPAIGVELKVASRFQEEIAPLWERLNKDIEKCQGGPAVDCIAENGSVVMICIGITYLNSDVVELKKADGIEVKKIYEDAMTTAIAAEGEEIPEDLDRSLWIAWWTDTFS